MKQIIQSFKTGETILEEIPAPVVSKGCVLIKTARSLVSLGTERMLIEFGKANLIQKARQQPDKVKQVLDKIKAEGLMPTLEAVFNKLGSPIPLGYCNVGHVIAVGEGVNEFKIGDRVASNGNHAEIVSVPKNLVANIPDEVSNDEATFTVIGAIGLEGIRLCKPTLGETIVVMGLGLIGLVTAELLISNGCQVIGVDLDTNKVNIAKKKGVIAINPQDGTDIVKFIESYTNGVGADGVIITASAKSDVIISQAARMSRKRGRIILVGVIGLNLSRADFYEKELSFQVSCSYGPGRYDDDYEQKGIDYPLPYVRWTEKRNFETILNAIAKGHLEVKSLISEKVKLEDYKLIYNNISNRSRSIASILEYDLDINLSPTVQIKDSLMNGGSDTIGIIGAGNFTQMTLLPILKSLNANLEIIASKGGVSSTTLAKKYNIAKSTTDYLQVLNDPNVDLVLIMTRHNLHASQVVNAIEANKHVFVEKPLALNQNELEKIIKNYNGDKSITVGFNRRFSPHITKIKSLIGDDQMNVIATMNAGYIPDDVWVHDLKIGGGRIIGEACHYIDLISYITGSKINAVCMNSMGKNPAENTDNCIIMLKFNNGSTGVINYFSNGAKSYSKERIEIFSQGRTAIIDNFRVTRGYGFKGFSSLKTKLDKGHKEQFRLLLERIKNGGNPLISMDSLINTTKASFAAIQSLKSKSWIEI